MTAISAQIRTKSGTGAARASRNRGFVPGIIYGGNKEPMNVDFDRRIIEKMAKDPAAYTTVYEIEVDGKKEKAVQRELQAHVVSGSPLHVDFQRVDEKSRIHVSIPFVFINEDKSPGIKRGGMLNIVVHEIEVYAQAMSIPQRIAVDLDGLQVGDAIHLGDTDLQGVTPIYYGPDQTIAVIVAPSSMKSKASSTTTESDEAEEETEQSDK